MTVAHFNLLSISAGADVSPVGPRAAGSGATEPLSLTTFTLHAAADHLTANSTTKTCGGVQPARTESSHKTQGYTVDEQS